MTHLNNALSSLQASLTDRWSFSLPGLINSAIQSHENNNLIEIEILSKVEPVLANLFDDLNKSLIEGEYANNISSCNQKLQEIDTHITTRAIFDIPGQPDYTAFSQAVFTEEFLLPIRTAIKDYKRLLEVVEGRLNFEPQVNILFNVYKNEFSIDVNSHKDLKLFKLNVQVSLIDHTLSFDNNTFRKLITISHTLSGIASVGSISDILKKKCDFLVSKLTHRFDGDKTTKYAIDFQYHSLNTTNPPELDYYDEIIKGHYDNIQTIEFKNRYKIALTKFNSTPDNLDFDDYHALIKYFKDIRPDLRKLKELRTRYELFYTSTSSVADFDKKSREIVFCYLENNILSLELHEKQINLDNWEEIFSNSINKAESFKNSNFFPYFKIIDQFLIEQIENQYNRNIISFDIIDKLIRAYEVNLTKLSENLKICQETNYLTFQLDFAGSRTKITDVNGISWDCFIASSFVLPMDYKFWFKIVETLRADLVKFKALRDLRISLKEDIKEIYDVKNKLAESDKRHIEILSIFSAIVLFVSNEVQLFTHLKSVTDAVIFTLFFAYALGLFVMLIWFVTRPSSVNLRKLPLTHYVLIGVFLTGFISAGLYLYFDSMAQSNLIRKKQTSFENRIDSLRNEIKMDSLKKVHREFTQGGKP
ncbi:hypothetical protein [Pedobacter panaciterrae]|uniref:hypothetical protein n=1 Tax=Pedobacter panaciterrae TaxID=363849 RepID=UPI0025929D7F|nr:hypothetical protein [uncultured Pedobacter sp.]